MSSGAVGDGFIYVHQLFHTLYRPERDDHRDGQRNLYMRARHGRREASHQQQLVSSFRRTRPACWLQQSQQFIPSQQFIRLRRR